VAEESDRFTSDEPMSDNNTDDDLSCHVMSNESPNSLISSSLRQSQFQSVVTSSSSSSSPIVVSIVVQISRLSTLVLSLM